MVLLLRLFVLVLSLYRSSSLQSHEIPRVSVSEFRDMYLKSEQQTPVLVEDALGHDICESICDAIMSNDSLRVSLQRKRPETPTAIYDVEIHRAIDAIMYSSRHNDAFFCFEEGLLDGLPGQISTILQNCRECVFPDDDWFQYFPEYAQSTDCLVLAGEGATSTLHRDPFEWTGTSLCLEGSKVWRFIDPLGNHPPLQIDKILDSYRLASTAWDENISLSAGWQSDMTLYASRSETIPSARDFQSLPDKLQRMGDVAQSTHQLGPSERLEKTMDTKLWTTVQTAGDLLVIPAYWWHQTYGLEPSVAVASQRCSGREIKQVLQHIVDTTKTNDSVNLSGIVDLANPQETVQEFFDVLTEALENKNVGLEKV